MCSIPSLNFYDLLSVWHKSPIRRVIREASKTGVIMEFPTEQNKEGNEDSSSNFLSNIKSCNKSWHCPWGHTIVDNIAPLFKKILEENYISSSVCPLEDTKQNRSLCASPVRGVLDNSVSVSTIPSSPINKEEEVGGFPVCKSSPALSESGLRNLGRGS
ncbi:unnamed protein product [Lactuca saligna]|uniref:Uncharacterized protein n=1 Tax=Lactuca saligna TaxID=75948 RepID=A0AA35VT82_LACSI|nr:unnamed protein product [Lactuca saligna]